MLKISLPRLHLDGTPSNELAFVGLGTLLAGYVSGLAYTNLGNLYAGFMSGNTGHLAQQLVQINPSGAGLALSVIIVFVFGVALGTALLDNMPSRWSLTSVIAAAAALGLVSIFLSLDQLTFPSGLALVGLVGVQSVLHRKVDGVDLGRGYVTGYLVALGEALARPQTRSPAFLSFAAWLVLLLGVLLGTAAMALLGQTGGTVFVLIMLILAEGMLWRRQQISL